MKRLLILLAILPLSLGAATKSIVPRADNEGGLGTEAKRWQSANVVTGQFNSLKVGSFTTTNLYNPADATNHVTLATNSLNTALWTTIRNATNQPGNPLLPISGTLYAFGDSQTAGYNYSGADYTSGNFLLPQYIWPNMLGSNYGRTLLVSNFAVGSSRLSFTEANIESHFNTIGQLPVTWDGVVVAMGGWNDMGNETVNDTFLAILRRGYEAWIARLLIDNYGGISFIGWTRTGTGSQTLADWATTGDNNQPSVTCTNASKLPFWRTDYESPYGQTRWRTRMTAGEVTSFTITAAKSLALFFDSAPEGGTFTVTNNGEYIGTYSTLFNSTYTFPLVVWLEDVPATNSVVITSVDGTNYFLAAGWVTPKQLAPARTVIMAGMTANTANSRNITNLWKCNKAMESAVSAFSDRHPVYFANVFNSYVQATDQETGGGDISHFTPTGNLHISESFARAYRPSGIGSSNNVSMNLDATVAKLAQDNVFTGSNYFPGINLGGTYRTSWPTTADLTDATNHVTLATNDLSGVLVARITAATNGTGPIVAHNLVSHTNLTVGSISSDSIIYFGTGDDKISQTPGFEWKWFFEGNPAGHEAGITNSGDYATFYGRGTFLSDVPWSALPFTPQYPSANLTNWSALSTTTLTDATNNAVIMRTDANNVVAGSNYFSGDTTFAGAVNIDGSGTNSMDNLTLTEWLYVTGNQTNAESLRVSKVVTAGELSVVTNATVYGPVVITNTVDDAATVLTIGHHDMQNGDLLKIISADDTITVDNLGDLYAPVVKSATQIETAKLYITNGVYYSTNLYAGLVPDFNIPYGLMVTNDVFTFGSPANAVANQVNWCVCLVTNSAATAKAITAPANVHTQGTLFVTNMTAVTFMNYGGLFTNAIFHPMW